MPKRLELKDWLVESLRLTAFPTPRATVLDPDWWNELLGVPPDQRVSHPRRGQLDETGPFVNGALQLSIQPNIINWRLAVGAEKESESSILPVVGPYPEVRVEFLDLMRRWLSRNNLPELQRIAFGATVLHPVAARAEGYELLKAYLPAVMLDANDASDFLYQINRPREFSSPGLSIQINRLAKWSVASMTYFALQLRPSSTGLSQQVTNTENACRLEFDINTSADRVEALPGSDLEPLLNHLSELCDELILSGDIR